MKEITVSLPPLQSIAALETLDRLGSVKETAQALNLTQSAVSHKLRVLQGQLGFPLTVAQGRGVMLTSQARQYVRAVRPALQALHDAHQTVSTASGRLTISCVPGFAAYWLAPRLSEFRHLFPDIELHILTHRTSPKETPADLYITFSPTHAPHAKPLMQMQFFPVCSPEFAHTHPLPKRPEMLNTAHLLHLSVRSDWQRWLDAQNANLHIKESGVLFDDVQTMLAAAHAGQGICLGDRLTCETALRAGALVRPFAGEFLSDSSYAVSHGAMGTTTSSRAFETWVRELLEPRPENAPDRRFLNN